MWYRRSISVEERYDKQQSAPRPMISLPDLPETAERAAELVVCSQRSARCLTVSDYRAGQPPFLSEGPLGHRERMRDRLLERGSDGLADYELLEMLLFLGQPRGDTKPVAKRLINHFGSYADVLRADVKGLEEVRGIGPDSIAALKLVHEAAVHLARSEVRHRQILGNGDQLMEYLQTAMACELGEQFRVLFLDTKNQLIADEMQSNGTTKHTPAYVREVISRAVELYAAALIFVQNHPSGNSTPSMADIEMTSHMQWALQSVGISLHDHIILGTGCWTSLKKEGLI